MDRTAWGVFFFWTVRIADGGSSLLGCPAAHLQTLPCMALLFLEVQPEIGEAEYSLRLSGRQKSAWSPT